MHLGNVLSALLSWLSARSKGGEWLLRIEDIDPQRSRQEYASLLMDDLQWLGLSWDREPLYQHTRSDIYEHYYQLLCQRDLTYPCYCTRADLLATQAPHESDGRVVYPGTCRPKAFQKNQSNQNNQNNLSIQSIQNNQAATRLLVPDEDIAFTDGHYGPQCVNLEREVGDFIIRRKDGAWAYQLAVVVDDGLTGVTEVVRGRDLLLSSPQQIYLARLLGFTPPQFIHLPLLCNAQRQRLSKRDRSMDMASLRQHYTAPQLIGRLAHLVGLLPEPQPVLPTELLPLFSWDKIPQENIYIS